MERDAYDMKKKIAHGLEFSQHPYWYVWYDLHMSALHGKY